MLPDYDTWKQTLLDLAAERPNYALPDGEGCLYTNEDGTPSCIIGWAMERLGVPRPASGTKANGTNILGRSLAVFQDLDDRTCRLLDTAQVLQDRGTPWGEAVAQAIQAAEPEE